MILHVCVLEKFIEPFYTFLGENFEGFDSQHVFYIDKKISKYKAPRGPNVFFNKNSRVANALWLAWRLNFSKKIILHGLNDRLILVLLFLQPWLLNKCYWVVWGADLYDYYSKKKGFRGKLREVIRRFAIQRIGNFVTHIKGDFELARCLYGATGKWHECFVYPSNLYHEYTCKINNHQGLNLLLGNSAYATNNHVEILDKLQIYDNFDLKIYCPLSYGDSEYAKKVSDYGKKLFGDKFMPIHEFMNFSDYIDLLAKVDVAIFNHRRQQGMGNITTLLGLGKTVYMRSDVTSWKTLKNLGIEICDVEKLELSVLDIKTSLSNKEIVSRYFSKDNLQIQLGNIFKS